MIREDRTTRRPLAALAILFAILLALTSANLLPRTAAADAAPDTLLDGYLKSMRDSTDAYFGVTAQHPDTTGLDSVLTYGLAHPQAKTGRRRGTTFTYGPNATFNRALGGGLGDEVSIGKAAGWGRVSANTMFANGPDVWYGGGGYRKRWPLRGGDDDDGVTLRVDGGRDWGAFNRDHYDAFYSLLGALLWGSDRDDYLRRDGWHSSLRAQSALGWAQLGWRDELESPLQTTATWNLSHSKLDKVENDAATQGRARELQLGFGTSTRAIARVPLRLEAQHWTSDPRLGSEFRYHRTRLAIGGDVGLGAHVALAPQFEYRRLKGQALPQEALYMGGASTLRTFDRNALQGTGAALARMDLIVNDDVLTWLHVPHPAAFPLQIGAFGATGAVWGRDAITGRAIPTSRDFAKANEWQSEAGFSVLYRPGIPDPRMYLRFDYAFPVGPHDGRDARWAVALLRPLNLLQSKL